MYTSRKQRCKIKINNLRHFLFFCFLWFGRKHIHRLTGNADMSKHLQSVYRFTILLGIFKVKVKKKKLKHARSN